MKKKTSKINISGTPTRPRVCVYRSNSAIYAEVIDDTAGKTVCSASSKELKEKKTPTEASFLVGENLAAKIAGLKIEKVVFDRNRYEYHGRIKAVAEGLRKGGIKL